MRDLYSTHTSAGVAGSLFPAHAGDNSKLKQFKVNMAGNKASWIWDYFNKDKDDPMIAVCTVCKTYKWLRSKNTSTACKFLSFMYII